jgi:hypothetical protein
VVVTRLSVPSGTIAPIPLPPGPWRNLLTDATLPGGPIPPSALLAEVPHALLVRP